MRFKVLTFSMMLLAATISMSQASQSVSTTTGPASVVPNLIRYNGTLTDSRGYPITSPIEVKFSLYSQQGSAKGDESQAALWHETQRVSPNEKGSYTVYLGAATAQGLPVAVFTSVSAQWLGVKAEGEAEQARVLLVSVPYALKAGDSQTLGGLPASAFALAGSINTEPVVATAAVTPLTSSTVTTPGGTSGHLAAFSGTATIDNSVVFESGTKIGINTLTPSTTLDVNGSSTSRGSLTMASTGTATTSAGKDSNAVYFNSSAWDSSTSKAVGPVFQVQAEPAGNDTSSPSATLNLLSAPIGGTPAETGFSISSKGILKFATGQTFPGTGSGTITGVTASTGLSGGGTSGSVTLKNTGILAVTASTGLSSTGGQSPTLSVNSAVVPELAKENFFSTNQFIDKGYLDAINGNGIAVYAYNTSTNSTTPALYVENSDSTAAGDLAFEVYGSHSQSSCTVDVSGNLFCTGSVGPAVVKANKTAVAMYAVSSPENWVEDFGTAKLVNGVAIVHLNPDVAEAVIGDASYRVFPSPNGDCAGLFVTNRTSTTFEVHELHGGQSNIEFDYRVVAHRKGYESVRLPDITPRTQRRVNLPKLKSVVSAMQQR